MMAGEGALAINPDNPSGPFSGSHLWLTSLMWEETNFWKKLWVPILSQVCPRTGCSCLRPPAQGNSDCSSPHVI